MSASLLLIAGRPLRELYERIITREEMKNMARSMQRLIHSELTFQLVNGLVVIRRLETTGNNPCTDKKKLKRFLSAISAHPLAGLYINDPRFTQKLLFVDACMTINRRCLFNSGPRSLNMTWFVRVWKEVRNVAKLDLSKPADIKALHAIAFVSDSLLAASINLGDSPPFIACLAPKIAKLPGNITSALKRSGYLRIVQASICECCQSEIKLEGHAKAAVVLAAEALAVEDVILDPARFVLSVLDDPWPKSPPLLYRQASFCLLKDLASIRAHRICNLPPSVLNRSTFGA
ncbi:hypothetical protein HK097_008097 [Rhizophlyctis rosea]|uniref:Uncharacterized protein n=1 Tax=Rhizophlyctis rosea TaxID=64517 RepID=A0AAD5SCS6_9FUNG|nr:hypothetical protein HK097_008097 [Rhizophlyctis rosea]